MVAVENTPVNHGIFQVRSHLCEYYDLHVFNHQQFVKRYKPIEINQITNSCFSNISYIE